MDERHAACRSRSAAFALVMTSTDLSYRDNLAFVGHLDRGGLTGCPSQATDVC